MGDVKDTGVLIVIDGNDGFRAFHTGHKLDRAGNTTVIMSLGLTVRPLSPICRRGSNQPASTMGGCRRAGHVTNRPVSEPARRLSYFNTPAYGDDDFSRRQVEAELFGDVFRTFTRLCS